MIFKKAIICKKIINVTIGYKIIDEPTDYNNYILDENDSAILDETNNSIISEGS